MTNTTNPADAVEALERIIDLLRATDELQANGFADDAVNIARAEIARLTTSTPEPVATTPETLCEDCPPVGYPTDKTRCTPCPRRATTQAPDAVERAARAICAKAFEMDEMVDPWWGDQASQPPNSIRLSGAQKDRFRAFAKAALSTLPTADAGPVAEEVVACSDCPPKGYPTDETRCDPCPRRLPTEQPKVEKNYYQHLIDEGISERTLEQMIGEGWTAFEIYQAELEGGSIEPLYAAPTPPAVDDGLVKRLRMHASGTNVAHLLYEAADALEALSREGSQGHGE